MGLHKQKAVCVQVSVVYAVAIGEPHFGNIGPFAIGIAQWAGGFGGRLADCAASISTADKTSIRAQWQ